MYIISRICTHIQKHIWPSYDIMIIYDIYIYVYNYYFDNDIDMMYDNLETLWLLGCDAYMYIYIYIYMYLCNDICSMYILDRYMTIQWLGGSDMEP